MPLAKQIAILCRANALMVRNKAIEFATGSKLLLATVLGFSLGYLVLGYFLFLTGLGYLTSIAGFGALIGERILYLMYFFFFAMLVFSNAVIGYSSLFRNKTTGWLITLPIDHRAIFSYRAIETLAFSSWGLVFLSAPILLAFGQVNDAPVTFYFKTLVAYLPFLIIPACVASWLLVIIARYLNKWWLITAGGFLLVWVIYTIVASVEAANMAATGDANETVTFYRILHHTRISTNPFIPSTWMSDSMLIWSGGSTNLGAFNFMLLTSYSLMASLLTISVFSRAYYPAWVRSIARRAARTVNKTKTIADFDRAFPTRRIPVVSRTYLALARKDALTFIREPSQWGQVAVVVGLLLIYVLNLGNFGDAYEAPFWTIVISYLNLTVCALALSTLTTRFIFPQFSLEGRRLWIVGLAPITLRQVVIQKFVTGLAITGTITLILVAISGNMLGLPTARTASFLVAIAFMSFTLTSLAVGIGTLFPNLRESNPAKIVSGFGGTLCLILSFLYIVCAVAALVIPEARSVAALPRVLSSPDERVVLPNVSPFGLASLVTISLAVGLPPILLAIKRVKNLDYFAKI
ncbi:MAG: hypothetical protein P8J87_20830 [Verrucomicrobiales bacterium]|nr:hypothetical protein [Verrucomicrobiales bacterium]